MKNRRTGIVAPQIRDKNRLLSSAPQKKVYLHPDQIFSVDTFGEPQKCFKYCYSHHSLPNEITEKPAANFREGGVIAVEFGKRASILRINHSNVSGSVKVFVGDDFKSLKHEFTIEPDAQYADCLNAVSADGKVVIFSGSQTEMPFVEFVSTKAVRAMQNPIYQHSHVSPIDLIKIAEPVREKTKDMALIQKSVLPQHTILFDPQNIIVEGKKIRLSPTMLNGTPISYDEALAASGKLGSLPDGILLGKDYDLAAYLLARYGKNKNHRYDKSRDAYHLDQEFVYTNNMGMEFKNKNRSGSGMIASIGVLPIERVEDPDKYCKETDLLMEKCKSIDIVTPVYSIPMKPDRSLFYFVYRHYKGFWADKLRVELQDIGEARKLQEFLETVHHYVPNLEIEVLVNYELEPSKWMSCLCFCGYHKVSSVVIRNYETLFNKIPQKWEIIYEPTDEFLQVSDWIETIKGLNLTLYEQGDVVDRALYKRADSYEHIEQYMVNWLTDDKNIKLFERELAMPHTYKIK